MIGALLAWVAVATARAAVTYSDVPGTVIAVHVMAWRDGRVPAELRSTSSVERSSGIARIDCIPGISVIVSFARGDGSYLLDGPFQCPAEAAERRLDSIWRRTIRVRSPAGSQTGADVIWVSAGRDPPDGWPRCVWAGPMAECWGSAVEGRGALVFTDSGPVCWTLVAAGAPVADFQQSGWARLVLDGDTFDHGNMTAAIAHPVTPPERRASLRLDTALVPEAHAIPIGAAAVWVYGQQIPSAAWIELKAPRAAPVYLPLEEVAHAPASLPLWVTLEVSRTLDGAARARSGGPASTAVVTVFRLIDPPPPRGDPRQQPRRVFAGETIADAAGEFHFDGLGDADYEVLAWHPQFGRGIAAVGRGDRSLTVRLESTGEVRGRVIARGNPLAGVDVMSLPDPAAFAQAADLTDVKGGDARTGPDGRFTVSVAPGGGGEVRVGGGSYPIKRFPLPRAPLPLVDLGDIDLGAAIEVTVVLDQDPGCGVRATGPVGRSGLQVIAGTRAAPGLFKIRFPEEGTWEVHLVCGRDEHALVPTVVTVTLADSGRDIRLTVR